MPTDFGPIPVSQFKDESNEIFAALVEGRRVLISRYGKVVAAIEPASTTRHEAQLAAFAVRASDALSELNATDISQGSPSERVRLAEVTGKQTLLTRKGQVYGVLGGHSADGPTDDPDEQERLLEQFEREHPDATPAEFADAVQRATASPDDSGQDVRFDLSQITSGASLLEAAVSAHPDWASSSHVLSEVLMIRGVAQERSARLNEAQVTFERLIELFDDDDDLFVRRHVAHAMVELARLYTATDQPTAALALTDRVLDVLTFEAYERVLPSSKPLESA